MVKINRRLLPMKAHYLFFMGAMGPILPQLSVLGKQIGIAPEVMGYITSVLPIMYMIAKPLFGFVADYFVNFRKMVFISLITVMTLSYGSFYYIPTGPAHAIEIPPSLNLTVKVVDLEICPEQLLVLSSLCSETRIATCADNNTSFNAYISMLSNKIDNVTATFNLTSYDISNTQLRVCLSRKTAEELQSNISKLIFQGTCSASPELQPDCLYNTSIFWLFVIFMSVGTIGFNVVNSISDAICFDMLGESEEHKYGAQRVWGTIGFGLTALIAGIAVDYWTLDVVKSFTPALIIMFVFSGLDLLSASNLKLPKLSSSESIFKDVWSLVKHPAIAIFLVFATIAGIIDSFIIYFMLWHMEEVAAATGYMDQIKLIEGCVVAAECLAGEVPFFFFSGKIIKKLGYIHCMSMCFFFYAVRLALISAIPNPWYLVVVELFFQGVTYALCYTCIVAYASAVAPPGTSATVQGLMAGMDDGLGFSIGSLIGGLAFKRFGSRSSFMYFAIAALCTCVAHIVIRPTSRKKQYLPKNGYQAPLEQRANTDKNQQVEEVIA